MSGAATEYAGAPATRCFRLLSTAANTNLTSAFNGPACLRSIQGLNTKAGTLYLKLYDKASAPVVASDVPVKTIAIPASGAFVFDFSAGYQFFKGLAFAITGAAADADATALASGDITCLNLDAS